MPRRARKISPTNTYHVMLRGINRQVIFDEDEDARKFLFVLGDYKETCGFELYAYCLMSNHVHLLIKTGAESLEGVFKRVGSRYALWYNRKYERSGHLFQDRFRSEVVQDERAFLSVLRYILQNPMKAGLEKAPGTYPWSSYGSYAGVADHLTDTALALSIFPSREDLLAFLCLSTGYRGMEMKDSPTFITDEKACRIMKKVTGCTSVSDFQQLNKEQQKINILRLRENHLSLGQIARITGKSKTSIYRAIK